MIWICQHVEIITSKDTRHVNADSQMHDLIIIILKRESGGQGKREKERESEVDSRVEGLSHARPPFHCNLL